MASNPTSTLHHPPAAPGERLAPRAHDRGFFGHPRGLRTLFFTEMWERFSYYGMRAILTLFMIAPIAAGGLGYPPSKAGPIYAMYTSMAYLMCVPGGWIADSFLGQRRSVLFGGIVIMLGHIALAMHGLAFFYAGLGLVVIGTGLLKPNISAIVGQLYDAEDSRRDAGFSIFYMGINLGAFTAPIVCGWLAQSDTFRGMLEGWGIDPKNSWHWGFAAAAVGMFFGLCQYVLTGKNLGEAGIRPAPPKSAEHAARARRTLFLGFAGAGALLVALLLFDRTAVFVDSARWESRRQFVVSGTVAPAPAGESASNTTLAFAGGAAISSGEMEPALGKERVAEILAAAERGETEGSFDATSIQVGGLGREKHLESIEWKVQPEVAFTLSGRRADTGKTGRYRGGSAIPYAELEQAVGATAAAAVRSGVGAGERRGSLPGVRLELQQEGETIVLDDVEWRGISGAKFVLQVQPEGSSEAQNYTSGGGISFEALQGEAGVEKAGQVLAALDRGERSGALSGLRLKLGGLNSDNIHLGYTWAIVLIVLVLFSRLLLGGDWTPSERARLTTIFVLFLGAAIFWGVFEQAGSTLTLFADRSTRNSIFGVEFPSSWWQSANAALIVLLAPVLAALWIKLGKRNPSDPAKFSVGLVFAGLGFLVLAGGAVQSEGWMRVSPLWLFTVYLLHTIGELWLSPVGLSSMTKLAPARVVGLMMGVWFLATSIGNFIGGSVAGFYEDLPLPSLFGYIALSGGVMAFVMFLLVGPIKRMLARGAAA